MEPGVGHLQGQGAGGKGRPLLYYSLGDLMGGHSRFLIHFTTAKQD